MPEYGWTNEAIMLTGRSWVKYQEICAWLNLLVESDRTKQEVRNQCIAAYAGISKQAPFAKTKRFPVDSIYVDLFEGEIFSLINSIITGLSQSDRNLNINLGSGEGRGDIARYAFQAKQDATRQLQKNIEALQKVLCAPKEIEAMKNLGIYVQASFESKFGLVWTG